MDIYYEQYVVCGDNSRNKKKKIFMTIMMVIFILTACVFFLMGFMSCAGSESLNAGPFIMLGMGVLSVVSVFFLRRQKIRMNVDFDYILRDEKFVVVRVFSKKQRKKYIEVGVKNIQAMGKISGDNADRYISMPQIKKIYANMSEDEDKVYYAFFTDGANRTVLFFEPDDQMLVFFRRIMGRDIIDKEKKTKPGVPNSPMSVSQT